MVENPLMERADVLGLFLQFLMLSAMAFGGTNAVLPDMHRYVVDVHHWLSDKQFADAYTLSQATPGPRVMYVTLIGWQVAGLVGAVATTAAVVIASVGITLLVVRLSARNPDAPLRRAMRVGLAPIAIGLTLSSGWILVRSVGHDWRGNLLILISLVLMLRTRLNPLWLLAAGALAGVGGLV